MAAAAERAIEHCAPHGEPHLPRYLVAHRHGTRLSSKPRDPTGRGPMRGFDATRGNVHVLQLTPLRGASRPLPSEYWIQQQHPGCRD